jgi:hypothetical protein
MVFYCVSAERHRACVYTAGINATPILALCSMDVVAILVKCSVSGEGRMAVVCSAYLPYDSVEVLPFREMVEMINCCFKHSMQLIPKSQSFTCLYIVLLY